MSAQTTKRKTAATATKQRASAAPTQTKTNEDELTPTFKKLAWKAIDAIERIPTTINDSELDATNRDLINDANKAVDECKYDATTAKDKYVLHALQMAVLSAQYQAEYRVLDPNWTRLAHRSMQCTLEAKLYIVPDTLSEKGVEDAKRGTCNQKTGEWDEGISK